MAGCRNAEEQATLIKSKASRAEQLIAGAFEAAIHFQVQELETMRPFFRPLRLFMLTAFVASVVFSAPMSAQHHTRDPLTPQQAEEVAKAGIYPDQRVHLYTKYLDEHANTIERLAKRADTPARNDQIANNLEDFADLMDELGSNLDVYSDRKADIRKVLKPLDEAIQRWKTMLTGLPNESTFDVARTDALDSSNDLAEQAKQMMQDQDQYFKEHKEQAGQEWHMPTPKSQ